MDSLFRGSAKIRVKLGHSNTVFTKRYLGVTKICNLFNLYQNSLATFLNFDCSPNRKSFNKLGTLWSALLLNYNHTIKSRKSQINSLSTKLSINSWAPLGRRRFFRKMRQISELIEVAVSFFTLIGN